MAVVKSTKIIYQTDLKSFHKPEDILQLANNEGIESAPLNIENLIKHFGINIIYEDLGREISGYIEKRETGFVISINKYQSPRRQRFALAHEFSHFLLHQRTIEAGKKIDKNLFRDDSKSKEELEANAFASDLLMPEKEFKTQVFLGKRLFSELADCFKVSIAAARYRAYQLNYIDRY